MKSYIVLKRISIYAYHGVDPQETKVGNTFLIDLKLKTDISKAMRTDEISDTISYAEIYRTISEEMAIPSRLLEHVAARIIQRIFRDYHAIESIKLKLSKQNPPMGADIAYAGVEIQCDRSDRSYIKVI